VATILREESDGPGCRCRPVCHGHGRCERRDGVAGWPACTATPEPSVSPAADATSTPEATSTPNHGQSVSKAVHDAIASTTPGPERGEAVSEAACTAAHDGSTLPGGAQNAPGQADREAKDCTHPSNAGDDGEDEGEDEGQSGNSNGNGNTPGSQGSEESQGHGNNGH